MLDNRYKIYVGYEFEVEKEIDNLIRISRPLTGFQTNRIFAYHDLRPYTKLGLWRIEQDASLHNGAEFISPPMPMEDSFEMMRKFFRAITEAGSVTSIRCGCHTNICLMYGGKILKMDENALLHNINWRLLCSLWSHRLKTDNKYCKYLDIIFKNIKTMPTVYPVTKPNYFGKAVFNIYHGFISRRQSLWNKKGIYYELRFPGGQDYHLHQEKIETTVRHFSEVLNKSRLAVCKKNRTINKKMISYVNRVYKQQPSEIPSFNFLEDNHFDFKEISKLKVIKDIVPTEHDKMLCKKLIRLVNQIIDKNGPNYSYMSRPFSLKLFGTINKEHVVYYIIKYFIVSNHSFFIANIIVFRKLLALERIKFTIPVDEFDTDKLWIINLISALKGSSKINVINATKNSIKNTKTKILWDKMLDKNNTISVRTKYIKAATKHYTSS